MSEERPHYAINIAHNDQKPPLKQRILCWAGMHEWHLAEVYERDEGPVGLCVCLNCDEMKAERR